MNTLQSRPNPNRLRVLRAEHRFSQALIARTIGVSKNRYWRIENGLANPSLDEIARLVALFASPAEHIFPAVALPASIAS